MVEIEEYSEDLQMNQHQTLEDASQTQLSAESRQNIALEENDKAENRTNQSDDEDFILISESDTTKNETKEVSSTNISSALNASKEPKDEDEADTGLGDSGTLDSFVPLQCGGEQASYENSINPTMVSFVIPDDDQNVASQRSSPVNISQPPSPTIEEIHTKRDILDVEFHHDFERDSTMEVGAIEDTNAQIIIDRVEMNDNGIDDSLNLQPETSQPETSQLETQQPEIQQSEIPPPEMISKIGVEMGKSRLDEVVARHSTHERGKPQFEPCTFPSFLSSSSAIQFDSLTNDGQVLKTVLSPAPDGCELKPEPLTRIYISLKGIAHFPIFPHNFHPDEEPNRSREEVNVLTNSTESWSQQILYPSEHSLLTNDSPSNRDFYYNLDIPAINMSKYVEENGTKGHFVNRLAPPPSSEPPKVDAPAQKAASLSRAMTRALSIEPDELQLIRKQFHSRYGPSFNSPILFVDTGVEEIDFILGHASQARGLEVALTAIAIGETARIICSPKYGYSPVRQPDVFSHPGTVLEFIVTVHRTESTKNLHEMTLPEKLLYLNSRRELGRKLHKAGQYASASTQYEKALSVLDDKEVFKTSQLRRKILLMFLTNQACCQFLLQNYITALSLCNKVLDDMGDATNQKALYYRAYSYKARDEYELALRTLSTLKNILESDIQRAENVSFWTSDSCICTGVVFSKTGEAVKCGGSCTSPEARVSFQKEKEAALRKTFREISLLEKKLAGQHRDSLAAKKLKGFLLKPHESSQSQLEARSSGLSGHDLSLYDDKPVIAKSVQAKQDLKDAMDFNASLRDHRNQVPWYIGVWNATKFVTGVWWNYYNSQLKEKGVDLEATFCCRSRHTHHDDVIFDEKYE